MVQLANEMKDVLSYVKNNRGFSTALGAIPHPYAQIASILARQRGLGKKGKGKGKKKGQQGGSFGSIFTDIVGGLGSGIGAGLGGLGRGIFGRGKKGKGKKVVNV